MKKCVCFGEIMLRLNPEGYLRIIQADRFMASYAGAEASVAVSLANYGICSSYVTKVPANELGQASVNTLRRYGVDTENIIRGGDRLGIYVLEKGASQRSSKVIYDRAASAIATASPDEFDWKKIFKGADWFHFTGITPALSKNAAQVCLDACRSAKRAGVTVSCDLNYRKKLWSREHACQIMTELMEFVDVLIANEEDAYDVFGIQAQDANVESGKLSIDGYIDVAKQLVDRFSFQKVGITLRGSISANDNNWAGILYNGKEAFCSKNYLIHIVDRLGGGDSFCAGLIYSMLTGQNDQSIIDFAVAASCLKHTLEYDFNHVSVEEVKTLIKGSGSGRVQR